MGDLRGDQLVQRLILIKNLADCFDGGINAETAPEAVAAGADILVAGTAVFKAPDAAEAIHRLRAAADGRQVGRSNPLE